MFLLVFLIACVVTPQSPGGDDTNKHSGGAHVEESVDADAGA